MTLVLPASPVRNLKWSRYIPSSHFPTPKQIAFLSLPHREALYGGSAGGGKSDALLMGALQYADMPGYKGIILRRSVKEAKMSGSILSRAKQWLSPFIGRGKHNIRWVSAENAFYFPEGGKLEFGYMENVGDEEQYQGGDWLYVGLEEATHFLEDQYTYMFTRLRFGEDNEFARGIIPLRLRAATNPGSRGHRFIVKRFKIEKDSKGVFQGKDLSRPFIQANIEDNPVFKKDVAAYDRNLQETNPLLYQRLRWGNWDASPDAIMKREWFQSTWTKKGQFYHLHDARRGLRVFHEKDLFIFTSVDSAASERTGIEGRVLSDSKDQEPSWSVCSKFGMTPEFDLLWLDLVRGQWTIPDFVRRIVDFHSKPIIFPYSPQGVETYERAERLRRQIMSDRPAFSLIESNGVGQGVYQGVAATGIPVRDIAVNSDKVVRSTDLQIRAEFQGRVFIPQETDANEHASPGHDFPWLKELVSELFVWSGKKKEVADIIDTGSLAAAYVARKAHGNEKDPILATGAHIHSPSLRGGLGPLGGGLGGSASSRFETNQIVTASGGRGMPRSRPPAGINPAARVGVSMPRLVQGSRTSRTPGRHRGLRL